MSQRKNLKQFTRDFTLDLRLPTLIFHIYGGICSGKSWLIRQIREEYQGVAFWDIQKFYEARDCFKHGRMDWRVWREVQPDLIRELKIRLRENSWANIFLIESSGTNELVNSLLRKLTNVVYVGLPMPSPEILRERASNHRLTLTEIKEFNQKISGQTRVEFESQEHALVVCRGHADVCQEIRKRA